MNAQRITGWGLGLYFGSFVIAALLGLPRLLTYLAASGVGAATIGYALYTHQWSVVRERLVRWQLVIGVFLGIVCISYFVNRDSYDVSLTLKVVGYSSVFCITAATALVTGRSSLPACMNVYMVCLLMAMAVTLVVNNTNSHNHRLYGPTYQEGIQGTGLHHNEVGALGMTAVMLATLSGWRTVLLVTPPSLYTAYLAGSRGAVLGIVLSLLVFFVAKEILANSAWRRFGCLSNRAVCLLGSAIGICTLTGVCAGTFIVDDVLKLNSENRGISSGFTGRLDVWQGMVDHWMQNPVVGQGYGVVRGEARELGETADGGFLLLTAELGLAGLFLFLFLIYHTFRSSVGEIIKRGDNRSSAVLVFLVGFSFINIFESRFVGTGSIGLGMFFYVSSLSIFDPRHEFSNAGHRVPDSRAVEDPIQRMLL